MDELGSYAELSPSGTGVHVIAWADPEQVGEIGRNSRRGVEAYNHGRYFTVTGNAIVDAPIYDVTQEVASFMARHFTGESASERVRRRVGDLAADQVKRAANRTMTDNCARDGVRYARVPSGAETCGFCLMLASRGFVYHSRETAGEMSHYHRDCDCDCKIVPGFGDAEVEGYDPDALYEVYSEARGRAGDGASPYEISREIERAIDGRSETVAASRTYLNRSTELYRRMEKVAPLDGYYDIKMHSDGRNLLYTDADDEGVELLSVHELAELTRSDPTYDGGPVRLMACEAGRYSDGPAQMLSDELGVEVLAPTAILYVDFRGECRLARTNEEYKVIIAGTMEETGEWVMFVPRGGEGGR